MLENIGAYAVKDVAVYEKKDDMDSILGDRADVDKDYVMDVRLKKDYMTGFMINAEAGGGTQVSLSRPSFYHVLYQQYPP